MPRTSAAIKLWIRLTLPGVGQVGPGKIDLLRKIREHQSISAAAVFRRPVVAKWMGGKSKGGAKLTPTGEKLVEIYDAVVAHATSANRAMLDALATLAARRRERRR